MNAPRVLIVEDEPVIAMSLELFLEDLGCTVAGIAGDVQQALQLATSGDFDLAFVDINLHGQKAHVLPGVLQRRNKPFAFVTGYGPQGVLPAYADAPVVTKPFSQATIGACLARLKARLPAGDRPESPGS
jgi:CheY-like chemotaxis protein